MDMVMFTSACVEWAMHFSGRRVGPCDRQVAGGVRPESHHLLPGHEHHELRHHALCVGSECETTCAHVSTCVKRRPYEQVGEVAGSVE